MRDTQARIPRVEALREAQLALLRAECGAQFTAIKSRGQRLGVTGQAASGQQRFADDANVLYAHPFHWTPFLLIGNWR
jgi:CHAT domain-containing protein